MNAKNTTIKLRSGKQVKNDNKLIKIGRIRHNSWANEILKSKDIYIYEGEIVHIANKHKLELKKIGLSSFDFVKFVISNYNEVRKGTGGSYLLIVRRTHTSNMAAIELISSERKEFYIVRTASPISTSRLNKKTLLCANVR